MLFRLVDGNNDAQKFIHRIHLLTPLSLSRSFEKRLNGYAAKTDGQPTCPYPLSKGGRLIYKISARFESFIRHADTVGEESIDRRIIGISAHGLHRFIKAAIRKELRLSGKGFENIESARRIFRHDTPLPAEIKYTASFLTEMQLHLSKRW